jgi:SulP family sulfate permease
MVKPDEAPSTLHEETGPATEPTAGSERLYRLVPALESLRTYTWNALRLDVFAGLTVAAVAVPQAMAYASIAGLPPQYGLYTAIVMTFVGALLDSSKQLINGPTNAISIALLSALAFESDPNGKIAAAILLAFLIGLVQTGITLFRLGDLSRYISHAVIVGFTLGAAILLVLDQLKNLLGLRDLGDPHEHFLLRFGRTMGGIADTHLATLGIGLGTMALVLVLRAVGRRINARPPDFLLAIIAMALVVWLFGLDQRGVRTVGDIPSHLPTPQMPDITWTRVRALSGSAFAIGVLGLLEAIAMAKAIASRTRQKLDINQQCLSEGLANLVGSFFQCFPGSGSLTRSAINVEAGAVSQWSGVVAAAVVAMTLLLLAPFAYYIPRAALAGILLLSAWRLVDRKQLLHHLRTTRFDALIVLATAVSAIVVSVEFCILIGILLSFVMFIPRAARVHLTELILTPDRVLRERGPKDAGCERILVFSLEGELFFGSGPDLEAHFETVLARCMPATRVVVLRLKRVRNPDAVCLGLMDRFLEQMADKGVTVLLCGVRPDLAKVLRSSGLEHRLGDHRVFHETTDVDFSSTLEAVRHAYDLLVGDLCAACPRRGEMGRDVLYYMI